MSLAETKGKTRSKLALALLDVLVSKDLQRKSTVYGSDKQAAIGPNIIAAIECKLVSWLAELYTVESDLWENYFIKT